jgi:polysaccharide export outer membrane protein
MARARGPSLSLVAAAFACLSGAAGCRHADEFIWIQDVPSGMAAGEQSHLIAPGDVIGVRVWNQEANSVERARVREDGRISVPFLNDVEVAGMQPGELARRLEVKLKPYIVSPVVTVVVHERRPLRVSVVGKVARPGLYDLDEDAGVVHALAAAGGVTAFADDDAVFVLRSGYWADDHPSPARIRFRYDDLRRGKVPAATFRLRRGDVVVVE